MKPKSRSRNPRKGKGRGKDEEKELSWSSVILFLESVSVRESNFMFGASIRRRKKRKSILPVVNVTSVVSRGDEIYLGGGYGAVGSRVYKIGGDIQHFRRKHYPTEVEYCNIYSSSKGKSGEGGGTVILRCGKWKPGPNLSGGKPNPFIVTVNQKIYALAGPLLSPYAHHRTEKLSPLFEVLDVDNNRWETLPDPPFKSLYESADNCRGWGAQILSHTVVANSIYMFVRGADASSIFHTDPKFYSFDIERKEWKEWRVTPGSPSSTTSFPSPSSVADNLLAYNLGLINWASSADVVDNKMYVCVLDRWESGTKVFAYDLAAVKDVVPQEEEDADEPCHDHVIVLPVHGLNHVTDNIPTHYSSGFVTHQLRNTFCLVATYNLHLTNWIRVCTFDVVEEEEDQTSCPRVRRVLCARNVVHMDYPIGDYVEVQYPYAWCKVREQKNG